MHEKEYILQFLPRLNILGNYGTSKDVVEWPDGRMEQTAVKGLKKECVERDGERQRRTNKQKVKRKVEEADDNKTSPLETEPELSGGIKMKNEAPVKHEAKSEEDGKLKLECKGGK